MTDDLFVVHGKTIEAVLKRAVINAVEMHKQAGNPVAGWRNGKVILIPPEKIHEGKPIRT